MSNRVFIVDQCRNTVMSNGHLKMTESMDSLIQVTQYVYSDCIHESTSIIAKICSAWVNKRTFMYSRENFTCMLLYIMMTWKALCCWPCCCARCYGAVTHAHNAVTVDGILLCHWNIVISIMSHFALWYEFMLLLFVHLYDFYCWLVCTVRHHYWKLLCSSNFLCWHIVYI